MSGKKTIFSILISIVIIIAAVFAYRLFFSPKDTTAVNNAPALLTTNLLTKSSAKPTDEFLRILLSLKGLQFKTEVFDLLRESQLRDFSTILVPQIPGRPNPFAPIGSNERLAKVATATPAVATTTKR